MLLSGQDEERKGKRENGGLVGKMRKEVGKKGGEAARAETEESKKCVVEKHREWKNGAQVPQDQDVKGNIATTYTKEPTVRTFQVSCLALRVESEPPWNG